MGHDRETVRKLVHRGQPVEDVAAKFVAGKGERPEPARRRHVGGHGEPAGVADLADRARAKARRDQAGQLAPPSRFPSLAACPRAARCCARGRPAAGTLASEESLGRAARTPVELVRRRPGASGSADSADARPSVARPTAAASSQPTATCASCYGEATSRHDRVTKRPSARITLPAGARFVTMAFDHPAALNLGVAAHVT